MYPLLVLISLVLCVKPLAAANPFLNEACAAIHDVRPNSRNCCWPMWSNFLSQNRHLQRGSLCRTWKWTPLSPVLDLSHSVQKKKFPLPMPNSCCCHHPRIHHCPRLHHGHHLRAGGSKSLAGRTWCTACSALRIYAARVGRG